MAECAIGSLTHPTFSSAIGHGDASALVNLSDNERAISLLSGGALLAAGLIRKLPGGVLLPLAGAALLYRGWTGHCSAYQAFGIDHSRRSTSRHGVAAHHGRRTIWAVHIHREPAELYEFWRDFENLPRVMRHLASVERTGAGLSHWVARGPFGRTFAWDAEVINDEPGQLIAWQSVPGSQVATAGSVRFRTPPFREGTDLVITLKYEPPAFQIDAAVAEFLGHGVDAAVEQDLRSFKQLMETGEVVTARRAGGKSHAS